MMLAHGPLTEVVCSLVRDAAPATSQDAATTIFSLSASVAARTDRYECRQSIILSTRYGVNMMLIYRHYPLP